MKIGDSEDIGIRLAQQDTSFETQENSIKRKYCGENRKVKRSSEQLQWKKIFIHYYILWKIRAVSLLL